MQNFNLYRSIFICLFLLSTTIIGSAKSPAKKEVLRPCIEIGIRFIGIQEIPIMKNFKISKIIEKERDLDSVYASLNNIKEIKIDLQDMLDQFDEVSAISYKVVSLDQKQIYLKGSLPIERDKIKTIIHRKELTFQLLKKHKNTNMPTYLLFKITNKKYQLGCQKALKIYGQ